MASRRIVVVLWLLLAGFAPAASPSPAVSAASCSGAGCRGIDIANYALQAQGAAYELGRPPRDYATAAGVKPEYDCSGLVWWAAANVLPTLTFPVVSQEQYNYGGHLSGDLWDGVTEFPRGSLIFLHDEDPALGGGATHVSIYIADGEVMDCYNEGFGCAVHNARNDGYYRDHWLGATYPWGDSPAGTGAPAQTGRGVGSGQIPAILTNPGSTYREFVTPVAAWGAAARQPVALAAGRSGDKDPQALVAQQLGPLPQAMRWARSIDYFMPLHIELVLAVVLLVFVVRFGLSVVRYLIGLSPF
jgi:hypothetical protein